LDQGQVGFLELGQDIALDGFLAWEANLHGLTRLALDMTGGGDQTVFADDNAGEV
jgi:hypothetical protein